MGSAPCQSGASPRLLSKARLAHLGSRPVWGVLVWVTGLLVWGSSSVWLTQPAVRRTVEVRANLMRVGALPRQLPCSVHLLKLGTDGGEHGRREGDGERVARRRTEPVQGKARTCG